MDHLFKTRDEAVGAALEFVRAKHDRFPAPEEDAVHALWGVKIQIRRSNNLKPQARFLWPRFEKPLEAVVKTVGLQEVLDAMHAAEEGLFGWSENALLHLLQPCRYDLKLGMSFVSSAVLDHTTVSEAQRQVFRDEKWLTVEARQAIGGYGAVRRAVFTQLEPLLTPILTERGLYLDSRFKVWVAPQSGDVWGD